MKILLIDNYDSFTYNLLQIIGQFTTDMIVVRNDEISLNEVKNLNPDRIIISPGPGKPQDSKISFEIVKNINNIPTFGVCLGHQALGLAYGAKIIKAKNIMHGKVSKIIHNNDKIFNVIPKKFEATRYHSLLIDSFDFPDELQILATSEEDNYIMAIKHKKYPLFGVQFHPESYQTNYGNILIKNFIEGRYD